MPAECARQIGRAALLEQDNADEKQAHNHMQYDDNVKKNLHFLSFFPALIILWIRSILGAEEGT